MATILNIETSTEICSVSISIDGQCKDLRINDVNNTQDKGSHSRLLAPFINDILKKNHILPDNLDAVAISSGPGSYTGLRIGVSTCKGFCFGAGLPLISIDTLKVMANMAKQMSKEIYDFYVPLIDARRMEVYTANFNAYLDKMSETEAKIIDENSFEELKDKKTAFFGNGSDKCKDILSENNFFFLKNIYPSAEYMGVFSERAFNMMEFEDLVYFEPFYLKEFITTTPKNKIQNFLKK